MRVFRLIAGIVIVGLGGAMTACGGGPSAAPPAAAEAPAPSQGSQVLRDLRTDWQAQKDTMMKIADAMPEGEVRVQVDAAAAQLRRANHARRPDERRVAESARRESGGARLQRGERRKRKADMLKALADSYDYGSALLNEESEATIGQPMKDSPAWLGPSTRARIMWTLLAHTMDIYGQMAVYLRLNGVVPPASRGV